MQNKKSDCSSFANLGNLVESLVRLNSLELQSGDQNKPDVLQPSRNILRAIFLY
jgi:hypothetical protein